MLGWGGGWLANGLVGGIDAVAEGWGVGAVEQVAMGEDVLFGVERVGQEGEAGGGEGEEGLFAGGEAMAVSGDLAEDEGGGVFFDQELLELEEGAGEAFLGKGV